VIVPTLDVAGPLRRCLASIMRQSGVAIELIVVDQGSRDGTPPVALAAGAQVFSLARPRIYGEFTPKARNVGARHAAGEYLLHFDADMELPAGALADCVRASKREKHVAIVLHEVDAAEGYWACCKALERSCYRGSTELEAARFVRSDVFWRVGGYDEELGGSGEDWDIHRRYASVGSIGAVAVPVVHHLGHLNLRRHLRKKFAYGRTAWPYFRKGGVSSVASGMWRAYARCWRLLAGDPIHAVGFLALRVAEVAALTFGIAFERIAATLRIEPAGTRKQDTRAR